MTMPRLVFHIYILAVISYAAGHALVHEHYFFSIFFSLSFMVCAFHSPVGGPSLIREQQ